VVLWEQPFVGAITGVWPNSTRVKVHLCLTTWSKSIEFVGGLGFGAISFKQLSCMIVSY